MKSTKITKIQEQVLRDQVINNDQPGAVLGDFQTLLEFLGPGGVEAGGKYNLLPLSSIEELDERLSHPLRLDLKRPQLRSHPYLQGLNLLLRASGLAKVRQSGAKARLVLDPAMLDQWHHLNPTEQYFQLLEAWLRLGRAEMVGERGSSWNDLLASCLNARNAITLRGFQLDLKKPSRVYVPGFYGNLYLLALMDLFGILKVEQAPRPITPWLPAKVEDTPWGDALFTLIVSCCLDPIFDSGHSVQNEEEESAIEVPRLGAWQAMFQPYFPEWKHNLEFTQAKAKKGEFIFRVSLGKTWRRIAMPADTTLGDLVAVILRSVKFDSDHLYEIRYRDRLGATVSARHPEMDGGPWADDITIGSLPIEPGQEMQMIYDFGDNWNFKIKLERVEATDPKSKKPRILESRGESPTQYPDWDE